VTPAEIALLRSLSETDVVTFMPEDTTAAALTRFQATVESLREMQKAGWVELEVAEDKKRQRGQPGTAGSADQARGAMQRRACSQASADTSNPHRARTWCGAVTPLDFGLTAGGYSSSSHTAQLRAGAAAEQHPHECHDSEHCP
jgi:hypothetical protein